MQYKCWLSIYTFWYEPPNVLILNLFVLPSAKWIEYMGWGGQPTVVIVSVPQMLHWWNLVSGAILDEYKNPIWSAASSLPPTLDHWRNIWENIVFINPNSEHFWVGYLIPFESSYYVNVPICQLETNGISSERSTSLFNICGILFSQNTIWTKAPLSVSF